MLSIFSIKHGKRCLSYLLLLALITVDYLKVLGIIAPAR